MKSTVELFGSLKVKILPTTKKAALWASLAFISALRSENHAAFSGFETVLNSVSKYKKAHLNDNTFSHVSHLLWFEFIVPTFLLLESLLDLFHGKESTAAVYVVNVQLCPTVMS